MNFGERLIELRKLNGYTRESFAEYLGISKYTLRNYELSVNDPGSSFLRQISNVFDVSIDYLLGLTDEKERISSHSLKTSEYDRIKKYRELDAHGTKIVDMVLDEEHRRCSAPYPEDINESIKKVCDDFDRAQEKKRTLSNA